MAPFRAFSRRCTVKSRPAGIRGKVNKWPNSRSRTAPHRADEGDAPLAAVARTAAVEVHGPRVEGEAGEATRRPVEGRRSRAEHRIDARVPRTASSRAQVHDRLELLDRGEPPVAVAREVCIDDQCAIVARAVVQKAEEVCEGWTVRIDSRVAPLVGVIHAVRASAPSDLLLPLEARLAVRNGPIAVVHEARRRRQWRAQEPRRLRRHGAIPELVVARERRERGPRALHLVAEETVWRSGYSASRRRRHDIRLGRWYAGGHRWHGDLASGLHDEPGEIGGVGSFRLRVLDPVALEVVGDRLRAANAPANRERSDDKYHREGALHREHF